MRKYLQLTTELERTLRRLLSSASPTGHGRSTKTLKRRFLKLFLAFLLLRMCLRHSRSQTAERLTATRNASTKPLFSASDIDVFTSRLSSLYAPIYGTTGFKTCFQKVKSCLITLGSVRDMICIEHPVTDHTPDRLSKTYPATNFVWNRSCHVDQCGLVFVGAEYAQGARFLQSDARGYCKILFHVEPQALFPIAQNIAQYGGSVDIILTTISPTQLPVSVIDKTIPFLYGSSWIQLKDMGLHPKQKLISIIASAKRQLPGHKLRHELIKRYMDRLDVYGSGYRPINDKIVALKTYRYSVIIENSVSEFWFTEKLIDAFVTGTVPIYWGSPVVLDLFDARGMLTFNSLYDFEAALQLCSHEDYISRLAAIQKNILIAENYLNPERIIERFILRPLNLTTPS